MATPGQGHRSSHMTKRRETSTVEYGADESRGCDMFQVRRYNEHLFGVWDVEADSWVNTYDEYTRQDEVLLFTDVAHAQLWIAEFKAGLASG